MVRYLLVAAAALAAVFFSYEMGEKAGRNQVQQAWGAAQLQRKTEETQAIWSRVKNNEREREQQALNEKKQKENYDSEINRIRTAYAGTHSLRIKAEHICAGFAPATQTKTTSGGNEALAGTIALPDEIAKNLWQLVRDADELLAQCRMAQQFIRDTDFAPQAQNQSRP